MNSIIKTNHQQTYYDRSGSILATASMTIKVKLAPSWNMASLKENRPVRLQKRIKTTTLCIPMWSPTIVLTEP
jgi:hypothetical protein